MDFHNKRDQAMEVFPVNNAWIPSWKRILDVSLILLAMPLIIPVAALIAALIRVVSEGPVLFKQERVGYLGRRFMCFKFRTMFVGSDVRTHQGHLHQLMDSNTPMTKMDSQGDPRIIPLGKLIRSAGLDELPQLINVFRGEMSLVGPRPCITYEYEKYLPWQRERFTTLPGLTGLWQVSGKNRTTFVEMIQLDVSYARGKSFLWDLEILARTVPALIAQIWETRQRKAASPTTVSVAPNFSGSYNIQAYPLRKTVIAQIVRAERKEHLNEEQIKAKL